MLLQTPSALAVIQVTESPHNRTLGGCKPPEKNMNGGCMNGLQPRRSTSSFDNGQPAPEATSRVGAFVACKVFPGFKQTPIVTTNTFGDYGQEK